VLGQLVVPWNLRLKEVAKEIVVDRKFFRKVTDNRAAEFLIPTQLQEK
jgi:hypothetical protein